ncbi:hypothetical protein CAL26_21085 [Bordetella genomosp. 9]|uniref:Bacteriophage T7 tail fibre protein-like N-terminal domain-containing protein n=1 Tax=Bordetella genomosp. 9 TaxID=1416803 RepID=A0A261R540_9BORD|nr:phage tail fiber protein [Bordetella genomosp. 9]OZI20051.1 hypothetical protein CAL26_21085 [Bordetella genomosp. 9]
MAAEELNPWINSAGQDGERNSMQEFPCDGAQTSFEFNFTGGYIDAANVKAYLYDMDSGIKTDVSPVVLTGPNTIEVTPAPAANFRLVVFRDTQKTVPLVDFSNGAVMNESNLDKIAKQAVFNAAEMVDRFDEINASSADAIERSFTALTTAQAAVSTAGTASTNASFALAASQTAANTANDAREDASQALATANGINGKAQQALDNSADAVADAGAAVLAAQTALDEVQNFTGLFAECRLDGGTAANSIKLSRYNGSRITLGGTTLQIPENGLEVVPTGLTAAALYYVYAYPNNGAPALEWGTGTAWARATGPDGRQIKTGDASRLLVGMFRPSAGGVITDTTATRGVASWFNRIPKSVTGSAGPAPISSTTDVAVIGIPLLRWAGEAVISTLDARIVSGSAAVTAFASLRNGATVTTSGQIIISFPSQGLWDGASTTWIDMVGAEGAVSPTCYAHVDTGSAQYVVFINAHTRL